MNNNFIKIKHAAVHNLKNINLTLPKNKFIVFSGVSGSGKSSLAFDTIYAEGQRRYVESLSSYARQFLGVANKPNVEYIEGLSPAISIDQKNSNYNPRSIVGTITEIYDYLRVMFARIGVPYCINGHGIIKTQTKAQIFNYINVTFNNSPITLLSPVVIEKKGTHSHKILKMINEGFSRLYIDNQIVKIDSNIELDKNKRHSIYIIIDRFTLDNSEDSNIRLTEAIEACSKYSNGIINVLDFKENIHVYSEKHSCSKCDYSISELQPRLFSFNSPLGACNNCEGLGIVYDINKNLLFNYEKSILDGGIEYYKNFVDSENMLWQEFKILCDHYKININVPLKKLSSKQINIILNGSDKPISYTIYNYKSHNEYKKLDYIEGVAKKIKRLYNETTSDTARSYYQSFLSEIKCQICDGNRLNSTALSVKINNYNIFDLCNISVKNLAIFLKKMKVTNFQSQIISNLLLEIISKVDFLVNVGLSYLTLSRTSSTLSGGEFQRIRLATQIGSRLTGVLYVLDEPSIGLHQKDNVKLINILKNIRDLGNTLIVVEHDEETIMDADYLVELGPDAGINGGTVVDSGTVSQVCKNNISYTAKFLNGELSINRNRSIKKVKKDNVIKIIGARENNLKNINVDIPLNMLVCVTGVSGSGKSTLLKSILYNGLKRLFKEKVAWVGKHTRIENYQLLNKVILVSQQSIGKTSRSNPATYVKVFDEIRYLYSMTKMAKERGYTPGKFSFNMPSGRCDKCNGKGELRISMLFMADVFIKCDECQGKRYKKEVLQVHYREKNIFDVLEMTVDDAYVFFKSHPKISKKLLVMKKVGLGYIKLNQPAPHLSGGESQRVKLSYYLLKPSTGKTLYILDEPTTGLHFQDISKLIDVLYEMVNRNDSIIIIEHNLDMIKMADYIIDLGPEGGEEGGKVIAKGNPYEIIDKNTYTGQFLKSKIELDEQRIKNG